MSVVAGAGANSQQPVVATNQQLATRVKNNQRQTIAKKAVATAVTVTRAAKEAMYNTYCDLKKVLILSTSSAEKISMEKVGEEIMQILSQNGNLEKNMSSIFSGIATQIKNCAKNCKYKSNDQIIQVIDGNISSALKKFHCDNPNQLPNVKNREDLLKHLLLKSKMCYAPPPKENNGLTIKFT
jgi:hypothetical protein